MKEKIFIYGVPGSGKTYFSEQLRCKTGGLLIETDKLKDFLQKDATREKNPFVFLGTCQAYQYFGERTLENIKKGLQAVRAALSPIINDTINQHTDGFIMEGATLDPKQLLKVQNSAIILLVTEDELQHKRQFFKHRSENKEALDEFVSARMVQEILIKEASDYDIFVLKNTGDMEDMLKKIENF